MRIQTVAAVAALLLVSSASQGQSWFDFEWRQRIEVQVTEPGVADRTNEYVDVVVDFSGAQFTDLASEVRVADAAGAEVPSLVYAIEGSTARVVFPAPDATTGGTQSFFVYWSNAAAPVPSYAFPAIPLIFYTDDAVLPGEDDNRSITGLNTLLAHGEIPLAVTFVDGEVVPYNRPQALGFRIAGIGSLCSIHFNLDSSSIRQDLSLWGFTDGNCVEEIIFGLTDPGVASGGVEARTPAITSYITQDFVGNELLGFVCDEPAEPDAGGVVEVVAPPGSPDGCHLRWDGGHVLPNGETLAYRSFFTGQVDALWEADQTAIMTRSLEFLLQENRLGSVFPAPAETRNCPEVPQTGCGTAAKSSLAIKNSGTDKKDKLTWKFQKSTDALDIGDLGDPISGDAQYSLCLYDHSAGTPRVPQRFVVGAGGTCGSKPCWKLNGKGTALSYKDKASTADGVQKMSLKSGPAGKGKLQLSGRGAGLALAPVSGVQFFDLDGELRVQLLEADGSCWESTFDAASTKKNTPTSFKAVAK